MLDCKFPRPALTTPGSSAPAWADPRTIMALCGWAWTPVVGVVSDHHLVAPADPKRVAIGFLCGSIVSIGATVAPVADVPAGLGWPLVPGVTAWLDIFTYGPLVNSQWYLHNGSGQDFTVVTVYRLN